MSLAEPGAWVGVLHYSHAHLVRDHLDPVRGGAPRRVRMLCGLRALPETVEGGGGRARCTRCETRAAALGPPPGVVVPGRWAHVRYHGRQHLVIGPARDDEDGRLVQLACGRTCGSWAVWHSPAPPHLERCRQCLRAEQS